MGGGRSAMNGGFGFPPTAGGAFGDFFGMPSTGMMGKDVIQTIREKHLHIHFLYFKTCFNLSRNSVGR